MSQVFGEVATRLSLDAFARLLEGGEWKVNLGRYAVRLSNTRTDCKFEPLKSGYLLADGLDGNDTLGGARLLSTHLAARDLQHRFEVYDEHNGLVAYLHHKWPKD